MYFALQQRIERNKKFLMKHKIVAYEYYEHRKINDFWPIS